MKRLLQLILPFILLLQGCIGANLKEPEKIEIPGEFNLSEKRTESFTSEIGFWKRFNNQELNLIIEKAFKTNYDLKSAISNIRAADLLISQADSVLYPQVEALGSIKKENQDRGSSEVTTDTYSISARVSYEIDVFGKIRNQRDMAILSRKGEVEDLKTIYISLASNITELYYNIVSINKRISLLKKNIKILMREKNLVEKRYESGAADYLALLDIQRAVSESRSNIVELKRSKDLSISAITILTGNFQNSDFKFETDEFPEFKKIFPKGIPFEIIKTRPDVKSAYIALKIKNKEVATKIAERFPGFSLSADFGRTGVDPDKGTSIYATTWSIAGGFLAPILDWGRRKAAVNKAKADWESSFFLYKKTILNAFNEIQDSINNIEKLDKSIEHKKDSNSYLRKKFILKKKQYELGTISFLQLSSVERELINPEAELNDLKKSYLSSLIELGKASGGNWTDKYLKEINSGE